MSERRVLISAVNSTVTGSLFLGEFIASQFTRFTGMFSVTGSATVRYRMGAGSGNYIVSSTFVVNSGPSDFDVLNRGRNVEWIFSAANSTQFSAIVFGQSQR